MVDKSFNSELAKTLARPDVENLRGALQVYHNWDHRGDDFPDEVGLVMDSYRHDPEMALAFVMLAAATYDDPEFLGLMAAGLLEDLLRNPSAEILERILTEARKSARIRWMLSIPYPHAIEPEAARRAIAVAVNGMTGDDPLPPRPWA